MAEHTVLRGGHFYCPECGAEVLNWMSQRPTWQCAHHPAWGEFASWIRGNVGAIKEDLLAHQAERTDA